MYKEKYYRIYFKVASELKTEMYVLCTGFVALILTYLRYFCNTFTEVGWGGYQPSIDFRYKHYKASDSYHFGTRG